MHASHRVRSTRVQPRKTGERGHVGRTDGRRRRVEAPARRLDAGDMQAEGEDERRRVLRRKKAELVSVLQRHPGGRAEEGRVPEDDQSPMIHGEYIEVRVNEISREQLGLVEAALARLESGEYGVCVLCERPIAAKRLAAIPWASHCVACQEKLRQ